MKSERGLGHRLPNQLGTSLPARGSLKGPLGLAGRTERAVTGVSEHALHQKARLVGAAAAAAVVFAGVRAQQTVTAGAEAAASHAEPLRPRAAGRAVQDAAEAVVEGVALGQAVEVALVGRTIEGHPLVSLLAAKDRVTIVDGTLEVSEGNGP